MNETLIHGIVEIYNNEEADNVQKKIGEMEDNFFNIAYSNLYLKNTGSILIPFAKSMRADMNDLVFLEGKLTELLSYFSWLGMVAVDVYIDTFHHGKLHYQVVSNEDDLLLAKSYCELREIPLISGN